MRKNHPYGMMKGYIFVHLVGSAKWIFFFNARIYFYLRGKNIFLYNLPPTILNR